MKVYAALLFVFLPVSLPAQEFKSAAPIEKEKYTYGMPVSAKKGSRFSKLNLVPGGWELWLVEVNGARPFQFADADQPNPTILEKARSCTRVHDALSAEGGSAEVTVVVRRPGNARGILVRVSFNQWDAGLEYIWRKWKQDPRLIILPLASTQVGSESFTARIDYAEAERLEEVAAYDLRKREDSEERKSPGAPLKGRESFRIAQRQLRLDAGIEKAVAADDAYFASRRSKAAELQRRASERLQKKDWFEAHRLARASMALSRDGGAGSIVDGVRAGIGPLDGDERGRLRTKVVQLSVAQVREKNLVDGAEGAAFCLFINSADKDAAKMLQQTRRAAFAEKAMSKGELDRWIGVLGPLRDLDPKTPSQEDVLYRVSGKVAKAGPFTLVETAKTGMRVVFEDKAGLKFDEGDSFTLPGFFEGGKPPASMPEELKAHPLIRLVVVRG